MGETKYETRSVTDSFTSRAGDIAPVRDDILLKDGRALECNGDDDWPMTFENLVDGIEEIVEGVRESVAFIAVFPFPIARGLLFLSTPNRDSRSSRQSFSHPIRCEHG